MLLINKSSISIELCQLGFSQMKSAFFFPRNIAGKQSQHNDFFFFLDKTFTNKIMILLHLIYTCH